MAGPAQTIPTEDGGRPLTGRGVLMWLFGFFGVMLIANGAFVYFAVESFPGVEVESAYHEGLTFDADIEASKAQAALGWEVDVNHAFGAGGETILTATTLDRNGGKLSGLVLNAAMRSIRGPAHDRSAVFEEVETGLYRADLGVLDPGQWDVTLDIERGHDRVYRSKGKLFLK
ncbi:MAG: FixH family protein [Rhodobiaceae bacterium]|nr:FixH family protein [Rhodobiaceae bacterium]